MAGFFGRFRNVQAAEGVQGLAVSNAAFACDLYGRLQQANGNLFFSPYSISGCLAMTCAGARGETARQMAQTLHFPTDQAELAGAFGQLQRQLSASEQQPGIQLRIANGLWCQQGHPFVPAFLDTARQTYQAQLEQVDFRTQAEPTRTEINDWVSVQTQGKLTDLLPPGMVDPTTRLVLVNAIYFKGKWAHPFKPSDTTNAPFSVSASHKVQAPLMHLNAQFGYAEIDGGQLLELPYASGDLSMVVLLPKQIDGLKSLEGSLTQPTLDGWLRRVHEQKVNAFLPRFKLTAQFSLGDTLAAMGMRDAFSPAADFSGMDGERDLFISAVVHKAFVEVNEEGTEAAAATGTVMRMLAVRPQPVPTFRADHPFVFLIREKQSGSILFLGRVIDPASQVN